MRYLAAPNTTARCRASNADLIRATRTCRAENRDKTVSIIAAGRKGRDHFRKQPVKIISEHVNFFAHLQFSHAQAIAGEIIDLYTKREVDAVDFLYNEFKSILAQRLRVERYLPIKPIEPAAGETLVDYIYEQPAQAIFEALLPRYVEIEVYRSLLESNAAELAARMTAMDAATNNAAEMIDDLTLHMNRVRQAAITKELLEIISGAEAIK